MLYRAKLTHLVEKLHDYSKKHSAFSAQLGSLDMLHMAFDEQLQQMRVGSGPLLYLVPILTNPPLPKRIVASLNACPYCGLWYKCNNYYTLVCGHTFHPWCLLEHT